MKRNRTWRLLHQIEGSRVQDGRILPQRDGGLEGAGGVLAGDERRPRPSRRRLGRVLGPPRLPRLHPEAFAGRQSAGFFFGRERLPDGVELEAEGTSKTLRPSTDTII